MKTLSKSEDSPFSSDVEKSEIVLLPVPFDQTSTWQKGADKGPAAILEAFPHLEFFDLETETEVYKKGLFIEEPIVARTSEQMIARVFQSVSKHLLNNKFTVTLGGEHSVSIGAIKACADKTPRLSVLQLDAHADLRDEYNGSKFNHACVMARVKEICPIVQVGIRAVDIEETSLWDNDSIFFAHKIFEDEKWIDKVIGQLGETVYVTIDLDVFDCGIMPSTGTPEPGGLGWRQVLKLLKAVARNKTVTGFDITELCPSDNKAPDFLAAKLIYTFLSYIWSC